MSYPNQKFMIIMPRTRDKAHPYGTIDRAAQKEAIKKLSGEEYKLWSIFNANQDNYKFVLSPAAFEKEYGYNRKTYYRSLEKLKSLGYITEEGNIMRFYETPLDNSCDKMSHKKIVKENEEKICDKMSQGCDKMSIEIKQINNKQGAVGGSPPPTTAPINKQINTSRLEVMANASPGDIGLENASVSQAEGLRPSNQKEEERKDIVYNKEELKTISQYRLVNPPTEIIYLEDDVIMIPNNNNELFRVVV